MAQPPSIFVVGSFVAACSVTVERFPSPGESICASAFMLEPGGKGFNQAVAARRLGARVDGLLAIGDDLFGSLAHGAIAQHDLPSDMLVQKAGSTGAGVGFIDRDGDTEIAVFKGANDLLTAGDVAAAADRIRAADLVTAQFEAGDAAIASAFTIARQAGALTMLNPSPYRPISPAILAHTDFLVMNRTEFQALAGDITLEEKEALFGHPVLRALPGVVITRGGRGLWARRGDDVRHVPAFPVPAVDGIGAGDAFLAGLAVALVAGKTWEVALTEASACGAITTTRMGVLDALPTANELESLLGPTSASETSPYEQGWSQLGRDITHP